MQITRHRVTKPTHGEQDWLDIRFWDNQKRKRVSASAVAAIYGLHPFVPADKYAAELLGDIPPAPIPPNPAPTLLTTFAACIIIHIPTIYY